MDEEVGATAVAVREDSEGEVEAEDGHVVDAAAVVGVDPGRDAYAFGQVTPFIVRASP
ncbi:hypothetical protein ACFW0I_35650 [[Kitasatospora] papulosa]|uniref:hypothetical protein n=1 Tax=[Kitasatospora] papulosa TaxID=1464011 RepID=UPI0036C9A264